MFKKSKVITLKRTYMSPLETVWQAWVDAETVRQWWGPEHTIITECKIDLKVGGQILIVMEADSGMGKYQGTRWPMDGIFTVIKAQEVLEYEAKSWTEGERDTSTIEHINEVRFVSHGNSTEVILKIRINKVGPKAKMAAFGMKFGYKAFLDRLADQLQAGAKNKD